MADVALRPTFPKEELERLRQQRLIGLLQARDDAATDRGAGVLARALRTGASVRHRHDRNRRHDQGVHARRSPGVLRSSVPARQRRAARRRRRRARQGAAAARIELRRRGRPRAGRRAHHAAGRRSREPGARCTSSTSRTPPQSQIRIGAVGVAALDARLLPDPGDEHDPRRVVQLAAEPEPARETRLHLRRGLGRSTCAFRRARSRPRPACRPTRRPRR